MKKLVLKRNKFSEVVEPYFHDGMVEGIDVSDDRSGEILLKAVNGKRYRLILIGLERFRCENFREGNIIFDMVVCTKTM